VIYTCLAYIISSIYININGPFLEITDYPFDEIIVFILSVVWLSIVFMVYDKRMSNYIKSLKIKNE